MLTIEEVQAGKHRVKVRVDGDEEHPELPALWPSVGEYPCYDEVSYQVLSADEVRNERFRAALATRACVAPHTAAAFAALERTHGPLLPQKAMPAQGVQCRIFRVHLPRPTSSQRTRCPVRTLKSG